MYARSSRRSRFARRTLRNAALRLLWGGSPLCATPRDIANCSIGIVMGCPRFAGATVASDKPRERDNRLMPDLGVGLAGQHLNQIGDNVGDANIPSGHLSQTRPWAKPAAGLRQLKPRAACALLHQ
jgi:hypothetical protein